MQKALNDIFGSTFEVMLKGEIGNHLDYDEYSHEFKESKSQCNGYSTKKLKISAGEVHIRIPRDCNAPFEPQVIPKRKRDIPPIEDKVIAMYACSISLKNIADTIEEIYGFAMDADIKHYKQCH